MAFQANLHGGPFDGACVTLAGWADTVLVSDEPAPVAADGAPDLAARAREGSYQARTGPFAGSELSGSGDYDWTAAQ